jgi:hypothetical protein
MMTSQNVCHVAQRTLLLWKSVVFQKAVNIRGMHPRGAGGYLQDAGTPQTGLQLVTTNQLCGF